MLQIRKKSTKTWLHTDSLLGDFILSKFYFSEDGLNFQIVEQGESKRRIFPITEIQVFDIGGSAETFDNITDLSLRLEALKYPAFYRDGETSVAIGDITDVVLTSLADGQILVYDSATSTWKNEDIGSIGASSLQAVTDVGNETTNPIYTTDTTTEGVVMGIKIGAQSYGISNAGEGYFNNQVQIDPSGDGSIIGEIHADNLTSTRVFQLPNNSGDLALTSDIPTNVSELTNDSGYITSADLPDVSGLVPYNPAGGLSKYINLYDEIGNVGSLKLPATISGDRTLLFQDKDYAGIADITDITADNADALKRDGSNANSDVDLGAYSLNAKSIKINGTGGSGHLSLKHQSAGITATTSESAIGANSSGNPIWKNDGNPQQELLLKNSTIIGATKTKITYDANGLVTSGADLAASDLPTGIDVSKINTGVVSNTEFNYLDGVTSSIQTQLNAKLSGYLYKNTTPISVTGTTSETQVLPVTIPANTFSASDIMKIEILVTKSGTAGIQTTKVKLSTSATMPSGTTDQIATAGITNTNVYSPLIRNVLSINGGNISGYNFTTSQTTDIAQSAIAYSTKPFDATVVNYLYVSITNASSGDTSTLRSVLISNL